MKSKLLVRINKLSEIRDSLQFVGLQFSDDIMANNVSFLDVIVNNTNHQKDKRNRKKLSSEFV